MLYQLNPYADRATRSVAAARRRALSPSSVSPLPA